MKICLMYGTHPNEYTKPSAEAIGRMFLERGHDVHIEEVPFEKTAWGVALKGGSSKEIEKALGTHIPNIDFDYLFEFHAGGVQEDYLSAEELGFRFIPKRVLGPCPAKGKPGVLCLPLVLRYGDPPPQIKGGYVIEIPQVDRPIPDRFLKLFKRRCTLFDDADKPDNSILEFIIHQYFTTMADKITTNRRYPPDIVAKTIVEGIEEYILKV